MTRPIDVLREILDSLETCDALRHEARQCDYAGGQDPRHSNELDDEADNLEAEANDMLLDLILRVALTSIVGEPDE